MKHLGMPKCIVSKHTAFQDGSGKLQNEKKKMSLVNGDDLTLPCHSDGSQNPSIIIQRNSILVIH
jgi:hypothetical protein